MALTQYSVFSSYLDQGIMSAVAAAVLWHLRGMATTKSARILISLIAAVAMVNVLFVLQGRTGHVVAIALLSLAIMWELPRRMRIVVVILPFVLVGFLYLTSDRVSNRLNEVVSEVQSFSPKDQMSTSSGIRLSLWLRATEMIAAEPLTGYGLGNWNTQYNNAVRLQNSQQPPITKNFNTHQEYLQWGVQLGVPGMLLFIGLMACIFRDGLRMSTATSRAMHSVLAAFAIACLFNSSLYDAYIGDFFCVAFGLLLALGLQKNEDLAGAVAPGAEATGARA
jgi:O-antigen ligase